MHDDTYEKRTCLFVELDPFSSYHPHNLDKTSLTFEAAGGTQTVKVTSNNNWTVS